MGPVGASRPAARSRRANESGEGDDAVVGVLGGFFGQVEPAQVGGAGGRGAERDPASGDRGVAAGGGPAGVDVFGGLLDAGPQDPEGQAGRGGQDALDHGAGPGGVQLGEGAGEDPGLVFLQPALGHGVAEGGEALEDLAGEFEAAGGVGLRPAQRHGDDLPGAGPVEDAFGGAGAGAAGFEHPAGLGEGGLVGVGEPAAQAVIDPLAGELGGVRGEQQRRRENVGGVEEVLGVGAAPLGGIQAGGIQAGGIQAGGIGFGEGVLLVGGAELDAPAHRHHHASNTSSRVRHSRVEIPASEPYTASRFGDDA